MMLRLIVIEPMKITTRDEQQKIRQILVRIDFKNGDPDALFQTSGQGDGAVAFERLI